MPTTITGQGCSPPVASSEKKDFLFSIGENKAVSNVFHVSGCAVKLVAWQIDVADKIEFEEVLQVDTGTVETDDPCCIVPAGGVTVTDAVPFEICGCVPALRKTNPRMWIAQSGFYRAVLKPVSGTGAPIGAGMTKVSIMKDCFTHVDEQLQGCCCEDCC